MGSVNANGSIVLGVGPINGGNYITASDEINGISISGTVSDSLIASVIGELVQVDLNGQTYSGAVRSDGTWMVAVPLSSLTKLANGQKYIVSASFTDVAGNTATSTANVQVDEASLRINTIDGNGFINKNNLTSPWGITITGSSAGGAGLGAFAGQAVTLTLNGKTYTTKIAATGNWSARIGHADIAQLTDGQTYVVGVNATDRAGNAASSNANVTVDKSATLVIQPVGGNNYVNTSNLIGGMTIVGVATDSVSGNIVGKTVNVTLNGTTYTGAVQSDGSWAVTVASSAVSNLVNGHTYGVTASVTDAAGNKATSTGSVAVDEAVLTIHSIDGNGFINKANVSSPWGVTIAGGSAGGAGAGAFAGQALKLTLNGKTYTTKIGTTGNWSVVVGHADLALLNDGQNYVVAVSATDKVGNSASTSSHVVIDKTANLSISPIGNGGLVDPSDAAVGIAVHGSSTDSILANIVGRPVTVALNGKSYTATVGADGSWSIVVGGADAASLTPGQAYFVKAGVTDLAGNTASSQTSLVMASPAKASLASTSLSFGNQRLGASATQAIDVTNAATTPAESLDGQVVSTSGSVAGATGRFTGLAPGAHDRSDLVVALDTSTAGAKTGSVVVGFASDSGHATTALPSQTIAISGSVFREASGSIAVSQNLIVHVGDTVSQSIGVTNTAVSDGYSESLIASIASQSGGITVDGTTTGDIAAGASNNALTYGFSTANAGAIQGILTLALQSDGTGIDGFGPTAIGSRQVLINATVNNYAVASLSSTAGQLQLSGMNYTLDLGTVAAGSAPLSTAILMTNSATGLADLLSGDLTLVSGSGFANSGLSAFSSLGAGLGASVESISLLTSTVGTFTETFVIHSNGSNASGYSGALPTETLTVTGTVVAATRPPSVGASASIVLEQGVNSTIAGIALSESGVQPGETFSVTLADANGILSASGTGVSGLGTNNLTLVGTLDHVNAALSTLMDLESAKGSDTLTLTAIDSYKSSSAPTSIAVTINGPLALTAPDTVGVTQNAITALSGISLSQDGQTSNETYTVALSDSTGLLNYTGSAVSGLGSHNLTIQGTLSQVNAVLATLTDTDPSAGVDQIQLKATDSLGGVSTAQIAVTSTHVPAPDLVVGNITSPAQAIAGQQAQISWTDTNNGDAAASGSWQDNVYLVSDADGDNPVLVGTFQQSGSLQAGQSVTQSALISLPDSATGKEYFMVKADAGNQTGALSGLSNHQTVTGTSTSITTTINWSSLEASTRPPTIDATDWSLIWDRLVDELGTTQQSAQTRLQFADLQLVAVQKVSPTPTEVLAYEIEQASGTLPNITLANTTDLADSGGGIDLSLTRIYNASFVSRNNAGVFGDGWTFTYGVRAVTDGSGNVYISSPSGTELFTLGANGTYAAQPGDQSTLALANGAYTLTNTSGTVEQLRPDGQLSTVTDSNGNKVAVSYDNAGVISGVTSSNGQTLAFTTNAEGRITSATNEKGRVVSYAYDASGDHLLSVTGPGGTTSYSYASSGNAFVSNALSGITHPDGTTQTYQYDSLGNLASQSGASGVGLTTYSYGPIGTVTETDAKGNTTTLTYDANGNLAKTTNAAGGATKLQYDSKGELTGVTTSTGGQYQFSYYANGNLLSYSSPTGGTVTVTYVAGTNLMATRSDQKGNLTHYSYDAAHNLTGITQQDGTGTTYQYSATGVLVETINARGQTTQYAYDAQDDLTAKSFSDGTSEHFGYNAQGQLISAQATDGGVTRYTYNTAGELTSLTDPQGRVESYSYNGAGQKVQRIEPDGSTTNYTYNSNGQLAALTDGSGSLITRYTYDASGALIRTDNGNGASTTYTYDVLGNVTQIQTRAADNSVTSQLNYTYDADSHPTTATSLDGAWTYSYDAAGQLTHAVFASTNASIPNQDLSYAYDAAGNRTQTIFNGAVTNYTTNGLNQYTSANGTTYAHDADGNLISTTANGQTTSYSYNAENKLVSQTGPSGTTAYQYDALGNLVSSTVNGVESSYINDPLAISTSATGSLSAITQVYNSSDQVQATYEYGNGLVEEKNPEGSYYYSADGSGNIAIVSGTGGIIKDAYEYSPSGDILLSSGDVPNIFQQNGARGTVTVSGSDYFFGGINYLPIGGQFIAGDPSIYQSDLFQYSLINFTGSRFRNRRYFGCQPCA